MPSAQRSRDQHGYRRTGAQVGPINRYRSVAIWGSCATRDAFAVQDRRAEVEQRLPLVYYGARSSWISQNSRPWAPPPSELGDLSGFAARMVHEDLAKRIVPQLVAHRPDVVVFDLIAERRPLVRFGRTWVTTSDYLDRTPLGKQALTRADAVVHLSQPHRAKLFAQATRKLARRLCQELPHAIFALNEAPYVTRVANGTSLPEPQAGWARDLQARQRPMFDALAEAFDNRLVRLTPPPEVCLADPDHRWGLTSYHLVADYHHWLLDRLLTLEHPLERVRRPRQPLTSLLSSAAAWRQHRTAPAATAATATTAPAATAAAAVPSPRRAGLPESLTVVDLSPNDPVGSPTSPRHGGRNG